jgi:hypothetical protein
MHTVQQSLMARARSRVNAVRQLCRKSLNLVRSAKERRGLQLMQDWLSPAQRQQFENFGYFDVVGCTTGRLYRIYHTPNLPNVYEINDVGRRKKAVCFAPVGALVKGDVMLAQKIALETDEQSALTVANIIPGLHWVI